MSGSAKLVQDDPAQIAQVLARTRATLRRAQIAFEELRRAQDGEHRVAAMCNFVVYGRAVTNVLQNLRSVARGFDAWYAPWRTEMERDPLLKYLYKLRSDVLKEGKEGTAHSLYISSLRIPEDVPPAPPNARGFFIGDHYGGIGWEVQLEDGTVEKVYVALPQHKARSWSSFVGIPREHLGSPVRDDSLKNVCHLYVRYLQRLVQAAKREFGPRASSAS